MPTTPPPATTKPPTTTTAKPCPTTPMVPVTAPPKPPEPPIKVNVNVKQHVRNKATAGSSAGPDKDTEKGPELETAPAAVSPGSPGLVVVPFSPAPAASMPVLPPP